MAFQDCLKPQRKPNRAISNAANWWNYRLLQQRQTAEAFNINIHVQKFESLWGFIPKTIASIRKKHWEMLNKLLSKWWSYFGWWLNPYFQKIQEIVKIILAKNLQRSQSLLKFVAVVLQFRVEFFPGDVMTFFARCNSINTWNWDSWRRYDCNDTG